MNTPFKLYLFLLIFTKLSASSQELMFQSFYTDSLGSSQGFSGKKTNDHGYIIAGYTGEAFATTVTVEKTDSFGNTQWNKSYSSFNGAYATEIIPSMDGGFVIGGTTTSSIGNFEMLLMKISNDGTLNWSKQFGGGLQMDELIRIMNTNDSGYILIGETSNVIPCCRADLIVVKTDSIGNIQWQRTYHGADAHEYGFCIRQTNDNGYVLVGARDSAGFGNNIIWMIKLDSIGNKLWEKTFGQGVGYSIRQTIDNGYIITGTNTENACLIKTDSTGNLLWYHLFINPASSYGYGYDVELTPDSGYVFCGGFANSGYLIKTDSSGDTLWTKSYSGLGTSSIFDVELMEDGGFCAFGSSRDFNLEWWMMLIKTDSLGSTTCSETEPDITDSLIFQSASSTSTTSMIGLTTTIFFIIVHENIKDTVLCSNANPYSLFMSETVMCPEECLTFTNLSLNANTFLWIFDGATPDTSTDVNPQNICYTNPGSYDVQLIATNANGSDTLLLTNYITVYPSPPPQSITQNGDTLFAISGAVSYQWYLNGNLLQGATNSFYIAEASGDYNLIATDSNGCEVEAAIFNVISNTYTLSQQNQITVFPTPGSEKLFLNSPVNILSLKILDFIEKELFTTSVSQKKVEIDIRFLSRGIYFLQVQTEKGSIVKRFIKE